MGGNARRPFGLENIAGRVYCLATVANFPETSPGIDASVLDLTAQWARSPQRAVILDFNGTLSDDEPLLLRVYTDMFQEHLQWALTPAHYFSILAGLSDREIIETVVAERIGGDPSLAERLLAERRTRYGELVDARSPILPATVEMVLGLHGSGVPLAIVTGAQRVDVEFVLARSPLSGLFSVIVTEEDVTTGKPSPEGFVIAADKLGIGASAILVFEDSLHGVVAAHAAGMPCIGVEGTKTRAELAGRADGVVARLEPGIFGA
jgi:beta-phosphoglucomutase